MSLYRRSCNAVIVRSRVLIALLALGLGLPMGLAAQMPTYSGKSSVTDAIDTSTGAVFKIGGGISMLFPKGLPVGHSRLVTLKKAKRKPKPSQIHKKFKPQGKALDFTGALNAPERPIILALAASREPKKKGFRLVLAMEIGTFCDASNKKFKLKSGLCSGWELHDAEYDHGRKSIIAKLRSTGGMRMQFGWVPEKADQ